MKIYICADIEGCNAINSFDEVEKFSEIMTNEVVAACNGAIKGGATEIYLKDAHDSGRNINPSKIPPKVKLIRGWTSDPLAAVPFLDGSFDGIAFIGFHSEAGSDANPLSHTFDDEKYFYVKINGKIVSELDVYSMAAAYFNVPVIFVSGDKNLISNNKQIPYNVATIDGVGGATITLLSCDETVRQIEEKMEMAVKNINKQKLILPKTFKLELAYIHHACASRASYYKGVKKINSNTIEYTTNDFYELLTTLMFIK